MALRVVEKISFTGAEAPQFRKLQDTVSRAVDALTKSKVVDGVLVGPVDLTTSPQPVAHGLGRKYSGWFVVRLDDVAIVLEDYSWNGQDASIMMQATTPCTVYLWVF